MRVVFESEELEHIYVEGREEGKPRYPPEIIRGFIRKVQIILNSVSTAELRQFKGLRFEALKGDYAGFHSIRINDQYRIILKVHQEDGGGVMIEVIARRTVHIHEITDYHKG